MPSDKQQANRLEECRERLLAERRFSLPSSQGRTAIVTVYDPNRAADTTHPADTFEAMDLEARRIERYLRWCGKGTVYFRNATVEDIWTAIDEAQISDVTVIGHAQLGRLHISPWSRVSSPDKRMMTFYDAISRDGAWPTISHLKQGYFCQRTSGQMSTFPLNIPFAWGFMANRAKIWASPQMAFSPDWPHLRPRAGLVNVAKHFGLTADDLRRMSYDRAKEVFGLREPLVQRRYPVPRFAHSVYDQLRDNRGLRLVHDYVRRIA